MLAFSRVDRMVVLKDLTKVASTASLMAVPTAVLLVVLKAVLLVAVLV